MADAELAALRAARLHQLEANAPAGASEGAEEEGKRQSEEQMRRDLLSTVLEPTARERRKHRYCTFRRFSVD